MSDIRRNQSDFAVLTVNQDDELDVYPAGHLLGPGVLPIGLVDRSARTWSGFVPWPHTLEQIDAVAALALNNAWDSNDCCRTAVGRPIPEPAETIRHGSFGPIVWIADGSTRIATQADMDRLPVGPDLSEEEEALIQD